MKLRVVNVSNVVTSSVDINNATIAVKNFIEDKFKLSTIDEDSKEIVFFKTNVVLDNTPLTANSVPTKDNGFWLYFNDQIEQLNQQTGQTYFAGGSAMPGYVSGYTQHNKIEVSLAVKYLNGNINKRLTTEFERSAGHEVGHTGGLPHPWMQFEMTALQINDVNQNASPSLGLSPKEQKKLIAALGVEVKQNLLNSGENPDRSLASSKGNKVTINQLQSMARTISKDRSDFAKKIQMAVNAIKIH